MIMICNVPDEVVKSVKMGTWCGSSVAEKIIANGIPLEQIRAEIDKIYEREDNSVDCLSALDELKLFIDKYKVESEDKE